MSRIDGIFGSWKNITGNKVIVRMLEEDPKGFEGGINARKYVGITRTSKATATRDLQQLVQMGAIVRSGEAGGRSISYQVNLAEL